MAYGVVKGLVFVKVGTFQTETGPVLIQECRTN